MKNIGKNIVGMMAAAIMATSCSSDFLETNPSSEASTGVVFENTDNVKMAVNGLALLMCTQHGAFSQGCCGENRVRSIYEEYPSEEFRYNYFAPGWSVIMNGTYFDQYTSSYATYPWTYYYEMIADANAIIMNVDKAQGAEAEKELYKAQALSYRAFAYTQLLKYYSKSWKLSNNGQEDGVVLRLDESINGMKLSTQAEVYNQIYKDCDDAIKYFDHCGITPTDVWSPSISVAYAVKARAALNREDYGVALENAKRAQVNHPLMSNDEYKSGFMEPNKEWIFGSYGDAQENNWYWTFGTQFACNGYYSQKTQYGAGDIAKEITDKIPNNDIRKSLFVTEDNIAKNLEGYTFAKEASVSNYAYTYGILGMYDDDIWDAADKYVKSVVPDAYSSEYIYINGQLKFRVFNQPGVSYLCWIRSSEMKLIEAEANYFLNNPGEAQKALEDLNKTRQVGYSCTKTGDELFAEIVTYRALELWGEGFNWYDHKRWNMPIIRKSIQEGGNCHVATAGTFKCDASNNYWTWKIPEVETEYNEMLKGNEPEM